MILQFLLKNVLLAGERVESPLVVCSGMLAEVCASQTSTMEVVAFQFPPWLVPSLPALA